MIGKFFPLFLDLVSKTLGAESGVFCWVSGRIFIWGLGISVKTK